MSDDFDDDLKQAKPLAPKRGAKPKALSLVSAAPLKSNGVAVHARGLEEPVTAEELWIFLGLARVSDRAVPYASLSNAALIMQNHPQLIGRVWFDLFRGRIMQTLDGVVSPWTDGDDKRMAAWLQHTMKLPRLSLQVVQCAVELAAHNQRRNSVTQWLESLSWDGQPRLDEWMSDCLGVESTAYAQAVGRNWLISMVARAYRPGCQADHMPVLEGAMGRGKSSAIKILGGEWYQSLGQAFGSHEFQQAIQGVWLAEIPDMAGFSKREHNQVIAALTTLNDHYRASYARRAEDHPRTVIFAASSETDDYLHDTRGIRRYWPVRCTHIDVELLAKMRDQLFAEATKDYKSGQKWYEMPVTETLNEQMLRQHEDAWIEPIAQFVAILDAVTVNDIFTHLAIEVKDRDHAREIRVAKCLRALGFGGSKVERVAGKPTRLYRRQ